MTAIEPVAERRRKPSRAAIARASTVRAADARAIDVRVEDLSEGGFRFSSASVLPVGAHIRVGLAGAGQATARIAWRDGEAHGCAFQPLLTNDQIQSAFTHAICESAVLSLIPDSAVVPMPAAGAALAPPQRFAARVRLILLVVASCTCWALATLLLRGLSSF